MSESKRSAEDISDTFELKKQKINSNAEKKGIQEADVGITNYVSNDIGGFVGTLKQRYTDFLVNEIGLDGQVVHFVDDGINDKKQRRRQRREKERQDKGDSQPMEHGAEPKEDDAVVVERSKPFEIDSAKREQLIALFGPEEVEKFTELIKTPGTFESQKVIGDKATRGKIHQLVREAFEGRLETKTTPKNTFSFSLNHPKSRSNTRSNQGAHDTVDENGVENWGLGPYKPFLHFNLYKENKDTMEAANLLARFLKVQPRVVRFAGTKDRRGVTVQRMCLPRFRVERVNSLNKALRGMKLGSFAYEDNSLSLGDLKGNEFVIALRDVQAIGDEPIEQVMAKAVESLKTNGFINYYGMQRFGTFSISTHVIGKEILLSNWSKAANLILSVQELVLPESMDARTVWEATRSAKDALEKMPKKCIAEWCLLNHLAQCSKSSDDYSENDYFNAIMKIPRNLRIMYGHAYQSYVWNCVVSRRMELFGMDVVAGDLVLEESATTTLDDNSTAQDDDDGFEEDVRTDRFQRARAVTQEEVDDKKFTVFDVVLPSPGFDINYPSNEELFNTYKDVMSKDGLDPNEMYRKVREFSFAGSYRKIVAKPNNLEYHIRTYGEPTQQLVLTDLDILQRKRAGEDAMTNQILPSTTGDRTAVILKLQLDTSAYATMALREVMKADTSRHGKMCDVQVV